MTHPDFDMIPPHPTPPVPKVSVSMITYNHEDFIGQAIESVLSQRTDFPFELIIGEDKSLDGTREVVLDYQRRYPDIIRLLLWRNNAGMMLNFECTLEACQGEYVAFCEGDDYWTDPTKLQRQVDLLGGHPEMALCHHEVDYVTYIDNIRSRLRSFPPESQQGTRKAADLIASNFIQTCSMMIRRCCVPRTDGEFKTLKLADWPISYLVAENGDIGYIDRNMADYRVHPTNQWNHKSEEYRHIETARMCFYLAERARSVANRKRWHASGIRMLDSLFAGQLKFPIAFRRFCNLLQQLSIDTPTAVFFMGRYFKRRITVCSKKLLIRR